MPDYQITEISFPYRSLTCAAIATKFFQYPTNNCQSFSVAGMGSLLDAATDDKVIEVLQAAHKSMGNRMALIEVKKGYIKRMDSIFKENVVVKSPYKSTNGSDMCLYLIKIPTLNPYQK